LNAVVKQVYVVVPDTVDDPRQPSGGNVYDRHLCDGLRARGWSVHERPLPGSWPDADPASLSALAATLDAVPDDARVLVDGLVGLGAAEVLEPERRRLRLVLLVHLPLALMLPDTAQTRERECRALTAATVVVTTSEWTRRWLATSYGPTLDRVRVARPGVHPADVSRGTASGGALLCVGAVTPVKGQDLLVAGLASVADLPWSCALVGPLDRDPGFAEALRQAASAAGLAGRLRFTGPLSRAEVDARYAAADLVVLTSRMETYGMVLTEALARGVPVLATDVGGVAEAVGRSRDGTQPGLLVPPEDPAAIGAALRGWLQDSECRRRLRTAAQRRRGNLPGWSETAREADELLTEAAR